MLNRIVFFTLTAFTIGSLGQVFRNFGVNIYLFDLFIVGANLYFLLFFIKKQKFYINSPLILFSFFTIFTLVTTIFQTKEYLLNETIYVLSFLFRFINYFAFTYFIYNLLKYGYLKKSEIYEILKNNFIILVFLNLIQYLFLNDISFMSQFGFDPHSQRLTGFFLDPNFMGFYLVIYILLNEYYLNNRYISYVSLIMIILTQSRSALLTLFLFLILYLFKNRYTTLKLFFVTIVLLLFSNFGARFEHLNYANDSASLRIESWSNALKLYNFGPIFGIGFSNYKNYLIGLNLVPSGEYYLNSSNYSDSSLLSILVFTGLFGLVLFMVFLLSYLKNLNMLSFIILILFNSIIINSLFFPPLTILIFFIFNVIDD